MNENFRIGIFDSGIGGVTVLKELIKILPNAEYIYYSDSKNNPYGDKTYKEIIEICENIINFFIEKNCSTVIIACNTASAIAADYLRKTYKELNIFAIEPAYKMVHDYAFNSSTLLMATKGTIESEKFNLLYNKYNNNKTVVLPCVGLANIIEENNKEKIREYLDENIKKYKGKVKNVVLGCTHYPLIQNEIKEVLGNVKFFDGAEKLAEYVKREMEKNGKNNQTKQSITFIDTSNSINKKNRFFNILK